MDPPIGTDGKLSAGGTVSYNLTDADRCASGADRVTVDVYHEPSDKPVAERTIRVERNVSFEMVDNAVKSNTPTERR